MTDDLISRQQAIMAIEQHRIAVLEGHKWDEGIEYGYAAAHRHLVDIIEQLPSVQPETNCSEIPNNSDTISRQAAIDVVDKYFKMIELNGDICIDGLTSLPSAQPERKDAVEKAVAVEAISDELMLRFDIPATYAYEVAEKAMNRIEEMAKELEKGEQE